MTLKAISTSSESMTSKIAAVEEASASKPKINGFIARFAKMYTPSVINIDLLTAIIPSFIIGEWNKWIYAYFSEIGVIFILLKKIIL